MSVHDVAVTVAKIKSIGVSFPQEGLFALLVERDLWIERGVNEYPVLIDVHESEIGYPVKMRWRHDARVPAKIGRRKMLACDRRHSLSTSSAPQDCCRFSTSSLRGYP